IIFYPLVLEGVADEDPHGAVSSLAARLFNDWRNANPIRYSTLSPSTAEANSVHLSDTHLARPGSAVRDTSRGWCATASKSRDSPPPTFLRKDGDPAPYPATDCRRRRSSPHSGRCRTGERTMPHPPDSQRVSSRGPRDRSAPIAVCREQSG